MIVVKFWVTAPATPPLVPGTDVVIATTGKIAEVTHTARDGFVVCCVGYARNGRPLYSALNPTGLRVLIPAYFPIKDDDHFL